MTDTPIAVLTDLHLEPDYEDKLFEALDSTLQRIQSCPAEKLFVLGDIIQETNKSTDQRLVASFIDRLDELGIPYTCLPGNHDVAELTQETYTNIVGNQRYGVTDNHVYLDSAAPHLSHGRGEISHEQLSFLEEALSSISSPIVFIHHPVHYHDIDDNRWFARSPEAAFCGNKEAVLDRLNSVSTDITAVINGHLHEWAHTKYRGIDHFTINSFNKTLEPNQETGAFALVEDFDQFRITQYGADGSEQSVLLP